MFAGILDHFFRVIPCFHFASSHISFDQAGAHGDHADPFLRVFMGALLRVPDDKFLAQRVSKSGVVFYSGGKRCFFQQMLHKLVFLILSLIKDLADCQSIGCRIGGTGSDIYDHAAFVHIFIELHVDVLGPYCVDHNDLLRITHGRGQSCRMDHSLDRAQTLREKTQLVNISANRDITGHQMDLMPLRFQDLHSVFKLRNCSAGKYEDHIFRYISGCFQSHAASAAGYNAYIRHFFLLSNCNQTEAVLSFRSGIVFFLDKAFRKEPLHHIVDRLSIRSCSIAEFLPRF